MSDAPVGNKPLPTRSPRGGAIEILQVLSLLALVVAWLLREVWILAACVGLVLFLVPFLLVQPEREPYVRRARGYKITPERRQKLAEIGVPDYILAVIDASMIDVYYRKRRNLSEALFEKIGQSRVRPWLNRICRHTKYYGEPAQQTAVQAKLLEHPASAARPGTAEPNLSELVLKNQSNPPSDASRSAEAS